MKVMEQTTRSKGSTGGTEAVAQVSRGMGAMETQVHCAYNQTRECFLGLDVRVVNLPPTRLGELMATQPLKSGEGVWMVSFRGIHSDGMPAPLDLIYLDDECRVVDVVESYPTFQVNSSSPNPSSVLALPAHSIYTSQTQLGDQLVLCVAEEMERQLQKLTGARVDTAVMPMIAGAALLREKPLWSGGPGLLELENRAVQEGATVYPAHVMDLTYPGTNKFQQLRKWLGRWWSPDPRKAPRIQEPGLAAYYWNGAAPEAKVVRDISASGLYVVTEERWYPGTLILMTLQKTEDGEEVVERSIAVQSRAVRWGPDGVGLQFLLANERDPDHSPALMLDAVGKKELEYFLDQLRQSQ
jgi:PilZ domain